MRRFNGPVMLGMTLGIAAGPALAGLLSDFFGWATPFLMVSCGCVLVLPDGAPALPVQAGTARRGPRAGLVQAMEHPQATDRQGCLERHRVAACFSGEVLRQRYGFSTAQIGISIAAFGVGLAVGNLAAGYLRRYLKRDEDMLLLVRWRSWCYRCRPSCSCRYLRCPWRSLPGAWGCALAWARRRARWHSPRAWPAWHGAVVRRDVQQHRHSRQRAPGCATAGAEGPPATVGIGIGLGIGAWFTVLDWFASRRSDEALPLRD